MARWHALLVGDAAASCRSFGTSSNTRAPPGLSGALPRQQTVPHVPGFGFNRFAMAMSASPPAVSACLVLQDWIKIKIRQRLL